MAFIGKVYGFFSSLRLTVYLLGFSVVLVFFGTLDQVNYGIYEAQRRYFQSLIAFWQYPAQWPGGERIGFLVIPMPGGYLLGGMIFLNLIFAHFRYFKARISNLGIIMIHSGLMLLLVGQGITDIVQKDYSMWIDEGGSANYAESFHYNELAVVETGDPDKDTVYSVPEKLISNGSEFAFDGLPFKIEVLQHFENVNIGRIPAGESRGLVKTSEGIGSRMNLSVVEAPPTYKQDERNIATAIIRLVETEGEEKELGTWIVSNVFDDRFPKQSFIVDDREFLLEMRFLRKYFPFRIHLEDFTHEKYPGTEIPKNFASDVVVENLETGEERESLIYMNNPLRFGGHTFYQASFGNEDRSSMLQVVRNPGWVIPYLSCALMSLGLFYQFSWSLFKFLGRRRS